MLLNLLPGLREIRAPLISGYLWLAFFFLALHDELPSSSHPDAVLKPIFDVGENLSFAAIAVVTGVAAYLVGSAMQELWKVLGHLLSPGRPLYGEAGIRASPAGRKDVESAVRARMQSAYGQLAQVAISPGEKGIADEPEPGTIERELPLIRTLLLGDRPELVGELDRLQAEADLRITVAFPVGFFAVYLAIKVSPGWMALLLPAFLLLAQGYQRQLDAGDLLAKALKIGRAEAPTLEAFSTSVDSVLQRVELEAELRKRMEDGDGLAAFQLGNLQATWDDFEAAVESLGLAVDKGVVRAYAELGRLYERRGDDERAERAYRDGAQRSDEKAKAFLAALLKRLDRGEEAREAADGISKEKPEVMASEVVEGDESSDYRKRMEAGDPKAAINLGLLLMRQHDNEGAAEALKRGTELDPEDSQAWAGLGTALEARGLLREAKGAFEKALDLRERQLGPDHLEVARDLGAVGDLLYELGQFEESRRAFERTLSIREEQLGSDSPELAESLTDLGMVLLELDEAERARDLMERGVSIVEHHDLYQRGRALGSLGMAYRELGRYSRARALEEEAVRAMEGFVASPLDMGTALHNLAVVVGDMGEFDLARKHLERAVDIFRSGRPQMEIRLAESLRELGEVLTVVGQPDQALLLFEEVSGIEQRWLGALHPQAALTLMATGAAKRALAELAQSEGAYRAALALLEQGPKPSRAALCLRGLAETVILDGRAVEARELISRAIEIQRRFLADRHPELATSYEVLARALVVIGDQEEAERASRRAAEIRDGSWSDVT